MATNKREGKRDALRCRLPRRASFVFTWEKRESFRTGMQRARRFFQIPGVLLSAHASHVSHPRCRQCQGTMPSLTKRTQSPFFFTLHNRFAYPNVRNAALSCAPRQRTFFFRFHFFIVKHFFHVQSSQPLDWAPFSCSFFPCVTIGRRATLALLVDQLSKGPTPVSFFSGTEKNKTKTSSSLFCCANRKRGRVSHHLVSIGREECPAVPMRRRDRQWIASNALYLQALNALPCNRHAASGCRAVIPLDPAYCWRPREIKRSMIHVFFKCIARVPCRCKWHGAVTSFLSGPFNWAQKNAPNNGHKWK